MLGATPAGGSSIDQEGQADRLGDLAGCGREVAGEPHQIIVGD
jgi:hypothetical protein